MLIPSFQIHHLLSSHTTIGIGGPARWYRPVYTVQEMQALLVYCLERGIPYYLLGKGSNSLFDDRGFSGAILHNKIGFFSMVKEGLFHVGAGYSFSLLGTQTARKGYTGLEFAAGIPGSVGGAIFMNAGANGKETADVLEAIDYVDEKGVLHTLSRKDLTFSYRFSPFQQRSGAIVGGFFRLEKGEKARDQQKEMVQYRSMTQPYAIPSAGCIFRNPSLDSAGALIEKMGWKGKKIGGAKVSDKHANFIVNEGEARAEEINQLIHEIQLQAKQEYNIDLLVEIRRISYDGEKK